MDGSPASLKEGNLSLNSFSGHMSPYIHENTLISISCGHQSLYLTENSTLRATKGQIRASVSSNSRKHQFFIKIEAPMSVKNLTMNLKNSEQCQLLLPEIL